MLSSYATSTASSTASTVSSTLSAYLPTCVDQNRNVLPKAKPYCQSDDYWPDVVPDSQVITINSGLFKMAVCAYSLCNSLLDKEMIEKVTLTCTGADEQIYSPISGSYIAAVPAGFSSTTVPLGPLTNGGTIKCVSSVYPAGVPDFKLVCTDDPWDPPLAGSKVITVMGYASLWRVACVDSQGNLLDNLSPYEPTCLDSNVNALENGYSLWAEL